MALFRKPQSNHTDKNTMDFGQDILDLSTLYPDSDYAFEMQDKMTLSRIAREVISDSQANHLKTMYKRIVKNPMRLPNRPTTGGLFNSPL